MLQESKHFRSSASYPDHWPPALQHRCNLHKPPAGTVESSENRTGAEILGYLATGYDVSVIPPTSHNIVCDKNVMAEPAYAEQDVLGRISPVPFGEGASPTMISRSSINQVSETADNRWFGSQCWLGLSEGNGIHRKGSRGCNAITVGPWNVEMMVLLMSWRRWRMSE